MGVLTALLDANVLYPAGLRDFLLRLANQCLYSPLWSADIHAEWIGSILADRLDLTADVLERTRVVIDRHFPDAVVTGYSVRAAALDLPDAGDRSRPPRGVEKSTANRERTLGRTRTPGSDPNGVAVHLGGRPWARVPPLLLA